MDHVRICRMFIAEDDDELRAVLVAVFRKEGYEVIEAVDGPDLVNHLLSARVEGRPMNNRDVVLSDMRMPGFSGLQVLASFNHLHWGTPFVLISAFIDPDTEQQARQLGAAAIFSKPVDIDDLRLAISKLVDAARSQPRTVPS